MEKNLPIFSRDGYFRCHVYDNERKRHQRALHIRDDGTQAAYRAAVAAYWAEQARATSGAYSRPDRQRKPLVKALDALREAQELAGLSEHYLDTTIYRGRWLMAHFGTNYDLHDLTAEAMVKYATEARKVRAAATVRLELHVLRQAAAAVGCTPPKRPKVGGQSKRQQPLTREQLQAFYLAVPKKHKLLALALITLGCRRSEVAKIDNEIDWDAQTMWMLGTKTKGSRRQLPIPDELFALMKEMRARGEWRGFPKCSRSTVDRVVRYSCKRAFGEERSVNDIRGTWSTLAGLDGVPAEVRAAFQGNSPEMQHLTYSQPALLPGEMRKAVMRGVPRINSTSAETSSADDLAEVVPIGAAKTLEKTSAEGG